MKTEKAIRSEVEKIRREIRYLCDNGLYLEIGNLERKALALEWVIFDE